MIPCRKSVQLLQKDTAYASDQWWDIPSSKTADRHPGGSLSPPHPKMTAMWSNKVSGTTGLTGVRMPTFVLKGET